MNFRRSDFDVTNRINTTDPVCVKLEVARIYRSLYHVESQALNRAFDDLVRLYYGEYPGYSSCDTQYHDLQHVLDVTLAMASNATILGFNVRPDRIARELAAHEGVEIRLYEVIYKLLEDMQAAMLGQLAPEFEEVVTGEAGGE